MLLSLAFAFNAKAHAQDASKLEPGMSSDSVVVIIQLSKYFNMEDSTQFEAAKAEVEQLFAPYEVIFVERFSCFAAKIGRTTIGAIEPKFRYIKEKYPQAMMRRANMSMLQTYIN